MKIDTLQKRDKALGIYNKYFAPTSDDCLDFSLFDTLSFYGAITDKESHELDEKMDKIGDSLRYEIRKFEEDLLGKISKS
jgi:hypothetical protein